MKKVRKVFDSNSVSSEEKSTEELRSCEECEEISCKEERGSEEDKESSNKIKLIYFRRRERIKISLVSKVGKAKMGEKIESRRRSRYLRGSSMPQKLPTSSVKLEDLPMFINNY